MRSKAKMFYSSCWKATLFHLFRQYEQWLEENKVKVITLVYSDDTLVVTYEELLGE